MRHAVAVAAPLLPALPASLAALQATFCREYGAGDEAAENPRKQYRACSLRSFLFRHACTLLAPRLQSTTDELTWKGAV